MSALGNYNNEKWSCAKICEFFSGSNNINWCGWSGDFRIICGESPYSNANYRVGATKKIYGKLDLNYIPFITCDYTMCPTFERVMHLIGGDYSKAISVISFLKERKISEKLFAEYLFKTQKLAFFNHYEINSKNNRKNDKSDEIISFIKKHNVKKVLFLGTSNWDKKSVKHIIDSCKWINQGVVIHPTGRNYRLNSYFDTWMKYDDDIIRDYFDPTNVKVTFDDFKCE